MSCSDRNSQKIAASELELLVVGADDGLRLDVFLARRIDHLGRAGASRLCRQGSVSVDGKTRPKSWVVRQGNRIDVHLGLRGAACPAPELPLVIALQTPDLVIADKPAGVPCGALVGKETATLAGALLHRFPEMARVGHNNREPGLVHRIDNFTSGLVLAARSQHTFELLKEALSSGAIDKEYLALVAPGTLPGQGQIETHLSPDARNSRRVVVSDRGHSGRTEFEVKERRKNADLVLVRVHTAYRHQIRCHLAHLGAPLLGDELYGHAHPVLGARHALHASYISGAVAEIPAFAARSELPEELRAILA